MLLLLLFLFYFLLFYYYYFNYDISKERLQKTPKYKCYLFICLQITSCFFFFRHLDPNNHPSDLFCDP